MKATFKKIGTDYLPAIKHKSGRLETLHGDALATTATATKYAQFEINERSRRHAKATPAPVETAPAPAWITPNQFAALCDEYLILPALALENETVKGAVHQKDLDALKEALATEF